MSKRRFYSSPENINGSTAILSADETHHLIHVLRLTPGDQAFVLDGCGKEYRCLFRKIADNRAHLEIQDQLTDSVESSIDLTLAQAMVKGDKFDFIVQKATELGVTRIAPLSTRYADVKLTEDQIPKKLERWRKISLEALKQSGRRKLVEVTPPRTLAQFLDDTHADTTQAASPITESTQASRRKLTATLLHFSERGGDAIADVLSDAPTDAPLVALVGPEGGWSDDESELLAQAGAKAITLGPRILRTETAAIVALTLILHATGEL